MDVQRDRRHLEGCMLGLTRPDELRVHARVVGVRLLCPSVRVGLRRHQLDGPVVDTFLTAVLVGFEGRFALCLCSVIFPSRDHPQPLLCFTLPFPRSSSSLNNASDAYSTASALTAEIAEDPEVTARPLRSKRSSPRYAVVQAANGPSGSLRSPRSLRRTTPGGVITSTAPCPVIPPSRHQAHPHLAVFQRQARASALWTP